LFLFFVFVCLFVCLFFARLDSYTHARANLARSGTVPALLVAAVAAFAVSAPSVACLAAACAALLMKRCGGAPLRLFGGE
jgi:hypothetical protein